ncbi:type II toxin-antitoxin system VapC family toxin [Pararhizobium sp. LjRoot238]|uniref:type II toxin-antitoxin system VapC family toxin n=1 Tax=Pararhizobium sp. LjRoot238 TaxID=3342293 RepID=UPI003F4F6FEC
MYILDTNVISEFRKIGNGTCHPGVLGWSNTVEVPLLYLSAITLMELEIGCLSLMRRDVGQATILRTWITGYILTAFQDRILPFDQSSAQKCAALHVPDRKQERDAMVAATALSHDFIVVTRNVRDFQGTGVQLLNPWELEAP